MAKESDLEVPVSVGEGDVTVEKSFSADEFPVPAITFSITYSGDEPVRLRLTDDVPESFSMEGIGFHPDFESDNWTAYRDHRVEYVRTLEPGETVETVYGIRIDDPDDAEEFLDPPTIELVDEGEGGNDDAEGVLGRDTTSVVRDALSGKQGVPGLDAEPLLSAEIDEERSDPRTLASDTISVVTPREVGATEPEADEREASEVEPDEPLEEAEETGASAVGAAAPETTAAATEAVPERASELEGVAAALASEIRAGEVADEDLELLREELDFGAPKSVDVRIGRLQSQIEDLLAYREALAEFIDDHGTADELLDEFKGDLDSLDSRLADVDASLSAAATERTDLRDDVSATRETVEEVESQVATLDEEMGDVRDDIASLDQRLVDLEDDVQSEFDEIQAELEDLREFRDRLSSAFGTGE